MICSCQYACKFLVVKNKYNYIFACNHQALKFNPACAWKPRLFRPSLDNRWYLDETFAAIRDKRVYPWRELYAEVKILDFVIRRRRDVNAAKKPMRKLLKRQDVSPKATVADKPPSYGAVLRGFSLSGRRETKGRGKRTIGQRIHVSPFS
ncbi:MAG: DDE-type integrase/transposase/recombinase [Alphaproteobacteria bacterium]|nr:DDE-type integrase/transposase/recombinase [Alphaproteobacteria bacterium]